MTNGNTAPLSPVVQENDMSKIREIFERAASAIAQASDLAKTVGELQQSVDSLKSDVERFRQVNSTLDEALTSARKSRDEALVEASNLRHTLATTEHDRDEAKRSLENANAGLTKAHEDLNTVRNDRDNALLEAMQAKDDLEKAQAKLKAIQSAMGIVEAPQPQPSPQAIPMPAPAPGPVEPAPTQEQSHPEPTQAPPSIQPQIGRRIYEGEEGFSWNKPNYFDSAKSHYYNIEVEF